MTKIVAGNTAITQLENQKFIDCKHTDRKLHKQSRGSEKEILMVFLDLYMEAEKSPKTVSLWCIIMKNGESSARSGLLTSYSS